MFATTPIASRYRVVRELGRGGMGIVFLVEHVHTGDQLALKVLLQHSGASAAVIERFKREARAPAKIKSENIVRVTDADVAPELDGAPFLVMELLEGVDLEKLVDGEGAQPPEVVVAWLRQAARALDKAHALGIVHRDLKPENLFLHQREDGSRVIKILDFGISKMLEPDGGSIEDAGLTRTGAIMGTPLYMSPEQAQAKVELIGPPTDQWALGLIAFRLLTGRVYWNAVTMAQLMLQIVIEPMPPPSSTSSLPPSFDEWFLRSCCRDPGRRFRTAGDQIEALAAALGLGAASVETNPVVLARPSTLGRLVPIPQASDSMIRSAAPVSRTFNPELEPTPRRKGNRAAWTVAMGVVALASVLGVSVALRTKQENVSVSAASDETVVQELTSSLAAQPVLPPVAGVSATTSASPALDAGVKPRAEPARRREKAPPAPSPASPTLTPTTKKTYDPAAP